MSWLGQFGSSTKSTCFIIWISCPRFLDRDFGYCPYMLTFSHNYYVNSSSMVSPFCPCLLGYVELFLVLVYVWNVVCDGLVILIPSLSGHFEGSLVQIYSNARQVRPEPDYQTVRHCCWFFTRTVTHMFTSSRCRRVQLPRPAGQFGSALKPEVTLYITKSDGTCCNRYTKSCILQKLHGIYEMRQRLLIAFIL